MIADMWDWDADHRGDALAIFALAPFGGPAIAPVVAGVLAVKGISWRWMFWIVTIYGGVCFALILFVLLETYLPYLTHKEAQKIRKETGDDGYYTKWERKNRLLTIRARLSMTILKPFVMLFEKPMLLLLTLYLSLVIGVVYLLFEALPHRLLRDAPFQRLRGRASFHRNPCWRQGRRFDVRPRNQQKVHVH